MAARLAHQHDLPRLHAIAGGQAHEVDPGRKRTAARVATIPPDYPTSRILQGVYELHALSPRHVVHGKLHPGALRQRVDHREQGRDGEAQT